MSFIRPLPSLYRGILFRSRNEARYATYLDRLGIAWEYEREAYALPSGNYLPDFYLPTPPSGKPCWVEIKGPAPTGLEHVFARELAAMTGHEVVLFDGPPLTGHNQGKSWGVDGAFSEPVCLMEDDARSQEAAEFSANVRWDRGGEAELPASAPVASHPMADQPPADVTMGRRLKMADLRWEHERLVAGALFCPEFFESVRDDLPVTEIADPGLAALWREMLAARDGMEDLSIKDLARRVGGNAQASAALAGLPDDIAFEEWIPDALRCRSSARAHEARRRAVLQVFAPSNPEGSHGPR